MHDFLVSMQRALIMHLPTTSNQTEEPSDSTNQSILRRCNSVS